MTPSWFGIIIVMVTEWGDHPAGRYQRARWSYGVAKNVLDQEVPLEKIFKGIFPFLIAVIVGVFISHSFPKIILY
ncbi:MAG: hypothetical protein U5K27_09930 [Desulfotignum sp.]|nr:hypothetical protein [Desulfotignum sp.]